MIVFENKSTRKIYAGQDEAKAFEAMQKAFPMFMKHLEPFAEAAKSAMIRANTGGNLETVLITTFLENRR